MMYAGRTCRDTADMNSKDNAGMDLLILDRLQNTENYQAQRVILHKDKRVSPPRDFAIPNSVYLGNRAA